MSKFWKVVGKLMTYLGLVSAIHGVVWMYGLTFLWGFIFIVFGCVAHEMNEGGD